jgi:hypothetical protein
MDGSETPHLSAVERDVSGAGLGLTKYMNGIWYGTILIGTPPKSFTGKVFRAFVAPTHCSLHISPAQHRF